MCFYFNGTTSLRTCRPNSRTEWPMQRACLDARIAGAEIAAEEDKKCSRQYGSRKEDE